MLVGMAVKKEKKNSINSSKLLRATNFSKKKKKQCNNFTQPFFYTGVQAKIGKREEKKFFLKKFSHFFFHR